MKIIRIVFYLAVTVLWPAFLSGTVHAQLPSPSSYLFVEVVDGTGQVISDTTVQLSDTKGKELLNARTDKKGTISFSLDRWAALHHYDLKISKAGYLPYETVLFPNKIQDSHSDILTEDMPDRVEPRNSPTRLPVKIALAKTPSTPAELQAEALQANKRKLLLAVKRGDAERLNELLRQGISANTVDARGVPAVAWATFAGDPETIKLLLNTGARVQDTTVGRQALLIYLAEGAIRGRFQAEIVDKLIEAGADVNASSSHLGTVLTKAILHVPLSLETIRALIKAGANVNSAGEYGFTPLMLAAMRNQRELLDLLLSAGAKSSIHAKDFAGESAFHHAVGGYRDSSLAIVNILLANGAIVTEANWAGETPLMLAAKWASLETIQTLLKAGAAIDAKDNQGQTALIHATKIYFDPNRNPPRAVRLLLANGARVNDVDRSGRSALMHALNAAQGESVKVLIAAGANVNLVDSDGQTALMLAVRGRSVESVAALLQAGAASTINHKDNEGLTALLYAVTQSYFLVLENVKALIAAGANVDGVNVNGETPLLIAVQRNDVELVKLLLAAHASVNIKSKNGTTPLTTVRPDSTRTDPQILSLLIAAGGAVNEVNQNGETPLMVAVSKQHNSTIVKALLEKGAGSSINARNKSGKTALMYAATYSDGEVVQTLLAAGANVNDTDATGRTVLMHATGSSSSSKLEIVRLLISTGANVNATDAGGKTALLHLTHSSIDDSDSAVLKELVAAGADVNAADANGQTILILLAEGKHSALIRTALELGARASAIDQSGKTALIYALTAEDPLPPNLIKALISAGADVNQANSMHQTPLMLAVYRHPLETVRMLLEAGAAVNVKDKRGWTALMFAISAPTEIVDALIAAKANVDDVDEWGQTALMFASHTKFLNTIERLLVAGASVDIKDRIEGKTALLHAANESLIATSGVVQKLITAGANVNEVDARGQTALMLAASTGALDSVLILLKAGAKLNVKDVDGKTPLMFAVWPSKGSTPDIVRTLIKAGARVNDVDMKGESALMIAAKYASTDILQVLVAARAKLDATNNQGQTALMVAIQSSRPWKLENVRFLLKSGANVNIKDNENITALELAKKLGESEIVTLLEQAQTRR